ncbi:MAG TPA: type IV secretion system DNA-binding domain-containing protein, partial [Candidatus Tumulicola sp.]
KLDELASALGSLSEPELATWHVLSLKRGERNHHSRRGFLLSTEELATLWHLPVFSIHVPMLDVVQYRQLEPPVSLPDPRREHGIVTLGRTNFRDHHRPFGLRPEDRRRHLYVVGKTGMGKSTLLLNLLIADIAAGRGCCLVDPHGDLAEAILAQVPSRRTNDVVFFDAGDQRHPLAFNPLANCAVEARPLVASGILTAFKKIWGDFFGPRMEHVFRNCLLALLEIPGTSLVSLVQLLGDARYRQSIVARLHDPVVRAFWLHEFAGMPAKLQAEAIAPIQNKVGQFVTSPLLRNILGQPRSTIDLRRIMDRQQILIINLSNGRMGEDASSLLGSLLITDLQLAAMSRANIREQDRVDFHLYVDEFQHFATGSFATILSEARKYRLNLTLANQYLAQMDNATAAAVFGNVGSLLAFQVGAQDAEALAAQLGEPVSPQDMQTLPKYEAYTRLLIDGLPSRPFSMRTMPAGQRADAGRSEIIRRMSQRRYARPVEEVAKTIEHAFNV